MLILLNLGVSGQIDTDRPNYTSSPNVVPSKSFQIETGYVMDRAGQAFCNGIQYFYSGSLNKTSLRYGLSESLELRAGWDFRQNKIFEDHQLIFRAIACTETVPVYADLNHDTTIRTRGWAPWYVGVKRNIVRTKKISLGVIGQVYVPFGSTGIFRTDNVGLDVQLPFNWYISDALTLAAQSMMTWGGKGFGLESTNSLALNYSPFNRWTCYMEGVYQYLGDVHANVLDVGLMFTPTDHIQLDLIGGIGDDPRRLNQSGRGVFSSFGICWLFDAKSDQD
ncbi:MAG: transporter [Flavobacteriales bacterium]|nr:transporter [Bacteroidota bacterium]MCB9241605.1 transporter [Flavobacteriales bacterium]